MGTSSWRPRQELSFNVASSWVVEEGRMMVLRCRAPKLPQDSVMGVSVLDVSRASFRGELTLDPSMTSQNKKAAVIDRLTNHLVSPSILQMRGCVMDNEFVYFITEPCLGRSDGGSNSSISSGQP